MVLKKTVIGSFPKLQIPIEEAIKKIIDLQLRNKIEIISDGEQRTDMINYFKDIPGFSPTPKGLSIGSKITPPEDPSKTLKIRDFRYAQNYVRGLKVNDVFLKTAITGPITLGLTCATSGLKHYSGFNDQKLYQDLSEALRPIISELLRQGSFVQLDEPGLSAGYMEPIKALGILENLISQVSNEKKHPDSLSIHVCGSLERSTKLLEGLFKITNLDVVSLGFSGPKEQRNLKLMSKSLFHNKARLGVGCVYNLAVNENEVDETQRILGRINEISSSIGKENMLYAHPDCSLRNVTPAVAEIILERLSQAVDEYNG
jgi:methionine synthase II (cobalamin-independent)